jgi:hypothetical protein
MLKYINVVQDANGDAVSGASVTIYNAGTVVAATIYSDDGVTPASNPLTTDSLGNFEFYAANGDYDIRVSYSGTVVNITDVTIGPGPVVAMASDVEYVPAGTGAVTTDVQTKLREIVSVKDFGAVGNGVSDDKAAFESSGAASRAVVIPESSYTFGSQPFANNTGFLSLGAEIVGSIYPPGAAAIGTVYEKSPFVFSLYASDAGSVTGGSANQHGVVSGVYVPSTSSAASYEKTAGYFRMSSADPSAGAVHRDAVAIQGTVDILSTNTDGRAWAVHGYASISAGGDGQLIAAEFESYNNGTAGGTPGTAKQKYGVHIVAQGTQDSTAGIYINGNSIKWKHGIWCAGSTVLSTNYITLSGGMCVDKDGRISAGKDTADAASETKILAYASSGNAAVKVEAGNTAEAFVKLTHTGTRNWFVGHETTGGTFAIGTGTSLTNSRILSADGNLNIGLMTNAPTYGSGQKVVFISNATAVPSSNPTGGGILYVESGALKYRGSSGTITTLGAA